MKEEKKTTDDGLTRRSFLKDSAGAMIAAGCLPALARRGTSIAANISQGAARVNHGAAAKTYVCPPCGLECDKLTFDKPGNCPNCGMKLIPVGGGADSPPVVAIFIFNGTELIDIAGPREVFGTAGFLVHTVAEKQEPVTMVFGQKVLPDYTFENSPKSDILLVPGGGLANQ